MCVCVCVRARVRACVHFSQAKEGITCTCKKNLSRFNTTKTYQTALYQVYVKMFYPLRYTKNKKVAIMRQ